MKILRSGISNKHISDTIIVGVRVTFLSRRATGTTDIFKSQRVYSISTKHLSPVNIQIPL